MTGDRSGCRCSAAHSSVHSRRGLRQIPCQADAVVVCWNRVWSPCHQWSGGCSRGVIGNLEVLMGSCSKGSSASCFASRARGLFCLQHAVLCASRSTTRWAGHTDTLPVALSCTTGHSGTLQAAQLPASQHNYGGQCTSHRNVSCLVIGWTRLWWGCAGDTG
jgi:hypothetical protein